MNQINSPQRNPFLKEKKLLNQFWDYVYQIDVKMVLHVQIQLVDGDALAHLVFQEQSNKTT